MPKTVIRGLTMIAAVVAAAFMLGAPAQAAVTPATADTTVTVDDVAPATAAMCKDYIKDKGYTVGPLVTSACNLGVTSQDRCYDYFTTRTDVWPSHARSACVLAGMT